MKNPVYIYNLPNVDPTTIFNYLPYRGIDDLTLRFWKNKGKYIKTISRDEDFKLMQSIRVEP